VTAHERPLKEMSRAAAGERTATESMAAREIDRSANLTWDIRPANDSPPFFDAITLRAVLLRAVIFRRA
jgi:hypothetical protein